MKLFLLLSILGFIGCGDTTTPASTSSTSDGFVSSETSFTYQGILEVADQNGGCFGGNIAYISYANKSYELSDSSAQSIKNTIQQIYTGNTQYQPFQTGGCHNKYNFSFNGIIRQEMVWKNGGNYLTDVVEVQSFSVK